jgi:hypothetical protein
VHKLGNMVTPVTPPPVVAPSTPVSVIDEGVQLIDDLVTLLENPNSTTEQVTTVVVGLVGIGAMVAGTFDHALGLEISSIPQTIIAAGGAVLLLGIKVLRTIGKNKSKTVASEMAAQLLAVRAVTP